MIDYIKISFGKWMTQIVSIIFFIIGARYLTIDEYGIFGIISVFIAVSNYLSRETIESLVVSEKIKYISAIKMTVEISLLIIITLLISLLFLDDYKYKNFVYIVTLICIGHWLSAPFKAKLVVQNLYSKYSFVFALSSLLSVIIGICLLILDYGVYALVLQQVTLSTTILLVSVYFVTKIKTNNEVYDRVSSYKPFFKTLPSSIIFVLSARLDVLIVSSYLGLTNTGIYTFCRRAFQILADILVGGLDKLLLKSHITMSKKLYFLIQVITFFFLSFITIISVYLIPILIGDKWSIASGYMIIMVPGATYFISIILLRSKYILDENYSLLLKIRIFELLLSFLLIIPLNFYSFLSIASIYFSFRFFVISSIMVYQLFNDRLISITIGICFLIINYLTSFLLENVNSYIL